MLSIRHITKTYGIEPLLKDITFNISAGERLGLIGPNGCGKSTLMRIIAGVDAPDSGSVVSTRPALRIGYLAQGLEPTPGATVSSTLNLLQVSQADLENELVSLASQLALEPENILLQEKYDSCLRKIEKETSPNSILSPLGLIEIDEDTPVAHLSGGQKTRLMLATLLLREPHLLLLDEPTNHLDIQMLEWLEGWLSAFHGAALIVSHDRAFLDHTVTGILELDPATQGMRAYPGNYSAYLEQKLLEREKQMQAYQDQQEELAQLKAAAAHIRSLTKMKKGGKADGGDKFAAGFFGNRATKNVMGRAKHIEARIEQILSEEKLEKPGRSWQMKLDFNEPAHKSKDICVAENLSIGYASHAPLLQGLNFYIRAGQRIALTGQNGSGKTTLLRTIMGTLKPLAGKVRLGTSIKPGYMTQEQERLEPGKTALEHIQLSSGYNETEARQFLHYFLFSGDDPLRPAANLSYGERARLMLALMVVEGCNFLLLDEPINHLDIPSRARFEQALNQFGGTVLAVVHDRYFIDRFANEVWLVDGKVLRTS